MADVIDDLELILTRAINYLTRILYDLCRRLNENSHRPFNRRSLVRWIAVFMPAPRKPKLILQTNLAATGQLAIDRWASCGSLVSTFSTSSVPLFEEELGDNIVRYRRGYGDEEFDGEMFEEPRFLPQHPEGLALTSTPKLFSVSSNSSTVSGDVVTKEKLVEMEEELASLRKQIAMLVMAQESSSFNKLETEIKYKNTSFHATSGNLSMSKGLSPFDDADSESEESEKSLLTCISEKSVDSDLVPVPPPPPLVPYIMSSSEALTLSEQLQQKKQSLSSRDDLTSVYKKAQKQRENIPDMAAVLKDLRNVKLKAVQRSPGGTPIRRQPEREPTDPSAIIAQALKKKFSSHWGLSSDSDKENDSGSFTSDVSTSFGKHKIRNAKKKLNMYSESSDSWTPVASPRKVEALG